MHSQMNVTAAGRQGSSPRENSNTIESQLMGRERIQSEKLVDTVVIEQSYEQEEEQIRYVEIEPRGLPEKRIIKVPKAVVKYEVEYIDKIVEVPQIQIISRDVEVPEYREVIKKIPVKQVVDVEKEFVKYVNKREIRMVEKKVEVRGETIEIPKPYIVENKVPVQNFVDKEVDTVVAQTIQPVVIEGATGSLQVTLKEYEPELVPIEVYIPCPIQRTFQSLKRKDAHFRVNVPGAQYNTLVRELNVGLTATATSGLLKTVYGEQMIIGKLGTSMVQPNDDVVHPAGTSLIRQLDHVSMTGKASRQVSGRQVSARQPSARQTSGRQVSRQVSSRNVSAKGADQYAAKPFATFHTGGYSMPQTAGYSVKPNAGYYISQSTGYTQQHSPAFPQAVSSEKYIHDHKNVFDRASAASTKTFNSGMPNLRVVSEVA